MKKYLLRTGLVLGTVMTITACADMGIYAPGTTGNSGRPPSQQSSNPGRPVNISVDEARRLAQAAGLTGRRALPPGIQRNMERGKPMPPGIARQVLPQNMLSGLPAYPGHEWRMAGDDLVLVVLGTLLVVEILSDVFR